MGCHRIFLLAAVLVSLFARGTLAQTVPDEPKRNAPEPSQDSLGQAIRAAEQATGGRARKAELERERGVDAYEINTVAKDKSASVLVDLASGKVLRVDGPGLLESMFDGEDRREDQAALAQLEASPLTLAAACAAAERETGGRAIEASLKSRYGQTLFSVGVVKEFALHKVTVDPASGRVVAQQQRKDDN
jgi:uncharacterized membrane protein YkoI